MAVITMTYGHFDDFSDFGQGKTKPIYPLGNKVNFFNFQP